jgi:hypothetical protein
VDSFFGEVGALVDGFSAGGEATGAVFSFSFSVEVSSDF